MVLWCQKQQNVGQDAWCNTLQRCLEDQNPEEQDVVIDYQILEGLVQARLPHRLIQIQRSWVSRHKKAKGSNCCLSKIKHYLSY